MWTLYFVAFAFAGAITGGDKFGIAIVITVLLILSLPFLIGQIIREGRFDTWNDLYAPLRRICDEISGPLSIDTEEVLSDLPLFSKIVAGSQKEAKENTEPFR